MLRVLQKEGVCLLRTEFLDDFNFFSKDPHPKNWIGPLLCVKEIHSLTLNTMEGACGKILDTEDPAVVIKKIHRRNRAQHRTDSHRAQEQARIQKWASNLCHEAHFKTLFVPRAWDIQEHQYKMERIDVSQPLEYSTLKDHKVLGELCAFYVAAKRKGIFPADFELYEQADGRVAMVDFDKFATWEKPGIVTFPWGLIVPEDKLVQDLPFPLQ